MPRARELPNLHPKFTGGTDGFSYRGGTAGASRRLASRLPRCSFGLVGGVPAETGEPRARPKSLERGADVRNEVGWEVSDGSPDEGGAFSGLTVGGLAGPAMRGQEEIDPFLAFEAVHYADRLQLLEIERDTDFFERFGEAMKNFCADHYRQT